MIKGRGFRPAKNLARLSILIITATCFLAVLPGIWQTPASSGSAPSPSGKSMAPARAPQGPVLSAQKVDSLSVDNGNAGVADPGDRIKYGIDIANTGMIDATNFSFTDTIDSSTTLVPGSLMVTPLALDDVYANVIGNTRFQATTINTGLLANDFDPDNPAAVLGTDLVVKAGSVNKTGGTVAGNGTLNAMADGTFTYDPPVGETGTEVFTYTITDSDGLDSVSTGTVTFTINELVWYVDNSQAAGGDGRSATPFNVLSAVNGPGGAGDPDNPGDFIFLFQGSGPYTGGLELEMNQKLIGQGVDLTVASQTLVTATGKPTITNSAGNGVTLASGNTVRGLTAGTTAAGGASAGVAGNNVGNLNIDTVMAMGDPGAGVDIQTSGTLAVTFQSITSDSGTRGVRLTNVGGGSFTSDSTAITNGAGDGLFLQSNTGTFNFTGSLSIATGNGRGVFASNGGTVNVVSGSTVDATGGAAVDIQSTAVSMPFGSLTSTNSSANGVRLDSVSGSFSVSGATSVQNSTGDGVFLQNNTVPIIGFNTLNICTTTPADGRGLVSNNNGAVNVTTGAINATGGAAVDIANTLMGMTFTTLTSTNSTGNGVRMNGATGSFTASSTTTITNAAAEGFSIANIPAGGTAISFSATNINNRNNTGVHISNANNAAGSISFGMTTIANPNNAGGYGIRVQSSSASVSFAGANITDTNQTVNEMDADGNLIPENEGDGDAIFLTGNTGSFALLGGMLTNIDNEAIDLRNSSNLTVSGVMINNVGTGAPATSVSGNAIRLLNVTGMNTIQNSSVSGFNQVNRDGLRVINTSADLTLLTVSDTSFSHPTTSHAGNDGIFIEARGSSTMNVMVTGTPGMMTGSIFERLLGDGIQASSTDTGTINIMVENSIFRNATQNCGAAFGTSGAGNLSLTFQDNVMNDVTNLGSNSGAIDLVGGDTGDFTALVRRNDIDTIRGRRAINYMHSNTTGFTGALDLTFDDNDIDAIAREAIFIDIAGPGTGGNVRITDNRIGSVAPVADPSLESGSSTHREAIEFVSRGAGAAKTVNLLIDGNTVINTGSTAGAETIDIDSENSSTVNATITNNFLTNNASEDELDLDAESSPSTLCANVSGNRLADADGNGAGLGNGTININLNEAGGNLPGDVNITQLAPSAAVDANEIDDANQVAAAQVSVATINVLFNQSACATPGPSPLAVKDQTTFDNLLAARAMAEGETGNALGFDTQLSAISYQLSAISGQVSAVSNHESAICNPQSAIRRLPAPLLPGSGRTYGYAPTALLARSSATSATWPERRAVKAVRAYAAASLIDGYVERAEYASMASGGVSRTAAPASGETVNLGPFTLPAGKAINIMFEADIDATITPPGATQVCNQGTATADGPITVLTDDPDVGGASDPTCTALASADLEITSKTDDPDPVFAGGNITYTIDFQNNGPNSAANVTVTDAVPANTTFVSAQVLSGTGWTITDPGAGNTGNVRISKALMANGEMAQFEIVVNVDAAISCGTTITNTATAASDTPDPNAGDNTATATTEALAPPMITCPAKITVDNDKGQCGASVMFNVTATGCPAPTVECKIGAMVITSPHTFPVGTTTVDCTATNGIMPDATCSFTVTVNDTEPPQVNCPLPIVRNNDAGQCSAVVSFTATANDNCPIGAPVCAPPSGASFPVGTTTVNCTATDQGGNQASCSFSVTVNDTENPTIACPANITVTTAGAGTTTVVVNYPPPMTADNCGVATVLCNPPSGSMFPLGVTTVTCTVMDTSNNTAQCNFTVSAFDVCIESDTNPGNGILFITTGPNKGDYRICCGGQTLTGRGTMSSKNGVINLTHFTPTRRVQAFLYMNQQKGTAALQSPPSAFPCLISDSNVNNNNCGCSAP
ncbi:MAG: HYR domain-containing protein [Blastocatellia bacterium]|nr:HYR domain-containing protein [Blastocatellia bacterium]